MANMLFTVFGILSPATYNIFLLLAVIGFFGVYIPWNEKRKKNGGKKPAGRPMEWKKPSTPMSRTSALTLMLLCFPVAVTGMTMLIASMVMGEAVWIALGGILTIASLLGMQRAGKDFRAGRPSQPSKPPKPVFRSESPNHEHIIVSGQGSKGRLEQLDTLKSAGLISDQEYRQKRQEILNGP